jgi:hypothetical protein
MDSQRGNFKIDLNSKYRKITKPKCCDIHKPPLSSPKGGRASDVEQKSFMIEPVDTMLILSSPKGGRAPEEDEKYQEAIAASLQAFDAVTVEPVIKEPSVQVTSTQKLGKVHTCKCGEILSPDKRKRLSHARLHCRLRGGSLQV